ncbi:diguanylate cyclase [Nocardia sp. ET3-3]|uniref:Diguanylate cyclase n=1 Tax=Nocardia terrae TaxID=2675851 RepID=A0A7K1VBG1_9NOCA|nr:GGDEF domain-containing protein [Nocardia terrae]MVU83428.1 diguanylate cyclase [Nocardia terrae]
MIVRRLGVTPPGLRDRERVLRLAADEYLRLLATVGYVAPDRPAAVKLTTGFLRGIDRISQDGVENASEATLLGAELAGSLPGLLTSSRFVGPLVTATLFAAPPAPAGVWTLHAGYAVAGYAEVLAERALGDHETILRAAVAAREHRITELQDRLQHAATHDRLTGLPNRAMLEERIAELLSTGRTLAVLLVDLDGFKQINDMHGHAVGDELLVAVAERLSSVTGAQDCVCRYGGDEFVIATAGGDEAALVIADGVLAEIARPFFLSTGAVRVRASIGIATTAGGSRDAAALIHAADRGMYSAKSSGGHRHHTER